jgi:iduronate 2-sulfatase
MPKSQTTNALVELIDIYPSLCELCGLAPPDYLEGTSFAPLLRTPDRPWKTAAFSCLLDYTTVSVRTDRYRLIQRATGQNELYDYESDPTEDHNLAADLAAKLVVEQLQAILRAGWRGARPIADAPLEDHVSPCDPTAASSREPTSEAASEPLLHSSVRALSKQGF